MLRLPLPLSDMITELSLFCPLCRSLLPPPRSANIAALAHGAVHRIIRIPANCIPGSLRHSMSFSLLLILYPDFFLSDSDVLLSDFESMQAEFV